LIIKFKKITDKGGKKIIGFLWVYHQRHFVEQVVGEAKVRWDFFF